MSICNRNFSLPAAVTQVPQKKISGVNQIGKYGADTFITLLLVFTIGFVASETHSANLIFKSNFGSGVTLNKPVLSDIPKKNLSWQTISGTDQETGFSWPISALGSTFTGIQSQTIDAISPSTVGSHVTNIIEQVTGPNGNPVNSLSQITHIKGPVGTWNTGNALVIIRPWTIGNIGDLYISYWYKHSEDLADQLDNTVSGGASMVQFSLKTGGYQNTWKGDYRISSTIAKNADGRLFWKTQGDNRANSGIKKKIYWRVDNTTVEVPVGEWFKYEVFMHRSNGNDGRFWVAVNGQIIADHRGPNMGDFNLPINRLFLTSTRSGGHAPVEIDMAGLEIWDDFPCGEGLPCHGKCIIN